MLREAVHWPSTCAGHCTTNLREFLAVAEAYERRRKFSGRGPIGNVPRRIKDRELIGAQPSDVREQMDGASVHGSPARAKWRIQRLDAPGHGQSKARFNARSREDRVIAPAGNYLAQAFSIQSDENDS